jgi:hypothetical protein
MKKIILAITLIAITTIGAQAQTSFGLKGGMTSSNLTVSGSGVSISMSSKIGFYAGAFAEIGVSENFAVQPEVLYALLGAQIKNGGQTEKMNLSYVNIPVLAKYKMNGFSIFAGPQIGILVSAKDQDGNSGKEDFKSTDFSGVFGAGYTTMSGFGFDARYQIGLGNISSDAGMGATLKNNAFYVGVHYKFNK